LDHEREDDLVGRDKIRKPRLWLKGVALANFRCNGLAPTQGETQIILLLDAKMHLVL
jgi:hypothetical protein